MEAKMTPKAKISKFFSYLRIKNFKKPLTNEEMSGIICYEWVNYTLFRILEPILTRRVDSDGVKKALLEESKF